MINPNDWKIGMQITLPANVGISGPNGKEIKNELTAIIDGMHKREDNSWSVSLKFKNGNTRSYIVPINCFNW